MMSIRKYKVQIIIFLFFISWIDVRSQDGIKLGAERTDLYLPLLKGKSVAIVANQTSIIDSTHLVDSLLSLGVNIKKIFSPEHGFRGVADAGEHVKNYKDKKTGLAVISLYGKNKKPNTADLIGIDVMLFDLQDVGVRFYTYISTLHYVMEACAENNKLLILLDRPNPNGHYVDGPLLEEKYKSYVGLHPIPLVHGMTIGEYAQMINGESWLKDGIKCQLKVITIEGYDHNYLYELPIKPSPNLPNMTSVYLYPSLGLFEGTLVSVGRGTETPFQIIGHPKLENASFTFTPQSTSGAKEPMYKGELCYGYDLRLFGDTFIKNSGQLYLYWLKETYTNTVDKESYFNNYFNSLAGNAQLKQQIIDGIEEKEIRKTWETGLNQFRRVRVKYLLYPDFN